ncbi:MAG TPA: acetyl-CoA hydrolase/transferase C-terminal domain-containing protein [Pseudonocardiaceae bacterium]|nr:acetyl-CoA hydrolase/transferase C-terminal domain-containing protein [Pseudonocardiaceae bacterium]
MPTEVRDHAAAAALMCDVAEDGELHVVSPMFPGQPDELLAALLTEAARRGIGLVLYTADLSGKYEFTAEIDPAAAGARIITIGGRVPDRLAPVIDYLPVTLYEIDRSFAAERIRVDVFAAQVAPPDPDGYCSFGPVVSYSPSAMSAARMVVLEVNDGFPRMPGHRGARRDAADVVVLAGADDVRELGTASAGPVEETIGGLLADLIPNGATTQLGIGSIPERFLAALAGHRNLRIHSGAIPEAAIELIDAGVFAGGDSHVTTSLLGTKRLYEYAADPRNGIRVEPVSLTHAPATLMDVGPLFSVNSAFEVDLSGQVNAEYSGGRKRASAGGQSDFGRWAHLTGANIIAMRARSRSGGPTIVPVLGAPHAVTTHRSDLDYVVTEFGVADLRSKTLRQRAAALAAITAPEHRAVDRSTG